MKKVIAWVLALAAVAAASVGLTLAFLTDTDENVNVMTLGNVVIEQLEYERKDSETAGESAAIQKFHDNKPLYPGVYDSAFDFEAKDSNVLWDSIGKEGYACGIWNPEQVNNELDKMVFVRNKGDYDAFVRTVFAFEAPPDWSFEDFQKLIHLNKNDTDWTWSWIKAPMAIGDGTYFVAVATYNKRLPVDTVTEISLSQVLLDKLATNEDIAALGDQYLILVATQGIQADGFVDPQTALDEGFGPISVSNLPFEGDKAYLGVTMENAIRYIHADGVTDISASVKSVVYGTFEDYPEVSLQNDGIMMDAEQDVEACVYYVKDQQGLYTVYILSDEKIYAPEDCTGLFANMSALTAVDTSNLDVSHVTVMDRMFYKCQKLTSVDVSGWDTSNVTSTEDMFYRCIKVNDLDVSGWDVSNVTSMSGMFDMFGTSQTQTALTYLDVSNWDVSNVTDMSRLFLGCNKLDNLDLSNWDVSNVTNLYRALGNLYSLTTWDIENWDVSSCTTLEDTFVNCEKIQTLDLSRWDVSNVTNMQGTFTSLISCTELNLSGWNTSKVTNMLQTFWNCQSMVNVIGLSEFDTSSVTIFRGMFGNTGVKNQWHLDLSKWDTSSATSFYMMFYNSPGVIVEGLENWDVSCLTTTYAMFYKNSSITELDLSGWNPVSLKDTSHMFGYCSNLETIYVSDLWTTAAVTDSTNMFRGCSKLVGGAGTKVSNTSATYARIDLPAVVDAEGNVITPAVPGYLTHINDKP